MFSFSLPTEAAAIPIVLMAHPRGGKPITFVGVVCQNSAEANAECWHTGGVKTVKLPARSPNLKDINERLSAIGRDKVSRCVQEAVGGRADSRADSMLGAHHVARSLDWNPRAPDAKRPGDGARRGRPVSRLSRAPTDLSHLALIARPFVQHTVRGLSRFPDADKKFFRRTLSWL